MFLSRIISMLLITFERHHQDSHHHYRLSISTCPSVTRWDLEFAFHGNLTPEYGPFGKLNRSDRFRVCDWRYNYFLILYLKICSRYISDGIWSENDHPISLEWENRYSQKCTDFRYSLMNMLMHFECFNSRLQRYDSVVKILVIKFALKDLLWMILMPQF
jgi:hypothetical protein